MLESYIKKTTTHFLLNSEIQLPVMCCMRHYACFCDMFCEIGHKVPFLYSVCFLLFILFSIFFLNTENNIVKHCLV